MTSEPIIFGNMTFAVHPSAALFPLMSNEELDALAADIAKNGLQHPIALLRGETGPVLIDGRNRAAAIARIVDEKRRMEVVSARESLKMLPSNTDPTAYVVSANIVRRHCSRKQKRELILALLKADPERSDRTIAGIVKSSPTTVGEIRTKGEQSGDVSKTDTHRDSQGRRQPARKSGESQRSRINRFLGRDVSKNSNFGHAEPAPESRPGLFDTPEPSEPPPVTPEPAAEQVPTLSQRVDALLDQLHVTVGEIGIDHDLEPESIRDFRDRVSAEVKALNRALHDRGHRSGSKSAPRVARKRGRPPKATAHKPKPRAISNRIAAAEYHASQLNALLEKIDTFRAEKGSGWQKRIVIGAGIRQPRLSDIAARKKPPSAREHAALTAYFEREQHHQGAET